MNNFNSFHKQSSSSSISDYSLILHIYFHIPIFIFNKTLLFDFFLLSDVQTFIKRRKTRKEPKKPNKLRHLRQSYLEIERKFQLNSWLEINYSSSKEERIFSAYLGLKFKFWEYILWLHGKIESQKETLKIYNLIRFRLYIF